MSAQLQEKEIYSRELDDLRMDALELSMLADEDRVAIDLPLRHLFTPGLYTRTIFMPKGAVLTSKIHKTQHPFVVTKGAAKVKLAGGEVKIIRAGHIGVTEPHTRRTLEILEDCVLTTFHPTEKTDLEEIEEELIERRALPDGSTTHEKYLEAMTELPPQIDYGGAP
jgi:quercetin dioxygenase-like cupin family protein